MGNMTVQIMSVGSIRRVGRRRLRSAVLGLAVTLLALSAHANKYGEKHITKNTKLLDHQYGSVVFDADNISLDCSGYEVHISSYSKPNCVVALDGSYLSKCAIVAYAKSNIKIKNCRIVGGFDYGVYLTETNDAYMENVQSSAKYGFLMRSTTGTYGTVLRASGNYAFGLWMNGDVDASFNNVVVEGVGAGRSPGLRPAGVSLGFQTNTYFTGLSVSETNGAGVFIDDSDGVTVADSEIFDNANGGVGIRWSDDIWFARTDVQYNGVTEEAWEGKGINLTGVHSSHFVDCNVTSNAPECDVYQGPDSLGNEWTRTTITNSCIYQEPR